MDRLSGMSTTSFSCSVSESHTVCVHLCVCACVRACVRVCVWGWGVGGGVRMRACVCVWGGGGWRAHACVCVLSTIDQATVHLIFLNILTACECNNHASLCEYNVTSSRPVCNLCSHNTTGDSCELCMEGFYHDPDIAIDDVRTCVGMFKI